VKAARCARCGDVIVVPDTFNLDEDMEVCAACEYHLIYGVDEGARE